MKDETTRIRKKAWPKIQAIFRIRAFYDTAGFIQQYNSHVLCVLKQSSVAIRHTAQMHLDVLYKLQRKFICELGLSNEEAFLAHQPQITVDSPPLLHGRHPRLSTTVCHPPFPARCAAPHLK